MSVKTLSWILLAAVSLGAVLLFNYWASHQWLSMLAYAGIVAALLGLANPALPLRFLGVRERAVGALVLAGGVALSLAALSWPASLIRVAQPRTRRGMGRYWRLIVPGSGLLAVNGSTASRDEPRVNAESSPSTGLRPRL